MNEALLNAMVALLIATSAAIAVIALLRPLVRRHCGATAALQLWWILPLSLAVAFVPKTSTVVWTQAVVLSQSAATEIMAAPAATTTIPWRSLVVALWIFGALATTAWLWLAQRRFTHTIRWTKNRRGVLPAGDGPAVVGAMAPRLALPEDFASRYSAHERRLILLHERIHLQRGDGIANLAMTSLLVMQWFNPLVHWASRALCGDQECACDALIIHRHPGSLKTYTEALLKSLPETTRHLPLVCRWPAFHPTVERISMLRQHRDLRRSVKLLAALFAAGLSLTSAIVYAVRPATIVLADAPPAVPAVPAMVPVPAITAAQPAPPVPPAVPATQPVPPAPPIATATQPVPPAPPAAAAPAAPAIVARMAQEPSDEDATAAKPQYRVNLKLTLATSDGATPPTISRNSREFAVVMQEKANMVVGGLPGGLQMTMSATQAGEGILLTTTIESGPEHKVIGKPSILVAPGKTGAIEQGKRDGTGLTDGFRLEVKIDPVTAEQVDALRTSSRVDTPASFCQADNAGVAAAMIAILPAGVTSKTFSRSGAKLTLNGNATSAAQVSSLLRAFDRSADFEKPELLSLRQVPGVGIPAVEFEATVGLRCPTASASI